MGASADGINAEGRAGQAAQPAAMPAHEQGSRAFAPGSPRRRRLWAGAAAIVIAAGLALALQSGGTAGRSSSAARYGGLPSWLPRSESLSGKVLDADRAHPVLAIQGNTVAISLAHGRVLATAVGPTVPEDGRFPVPPVTPCTFVITFADASGVVPISSRAFSFVDDQGVVRHPVMRTLSGGPIPGTIAPGRPVSLKAYAVLPTGDGGLEWSPEGGRPLSAWDFVVEID